MGAVNNLLLGRTKLGTIFRITLLLVFLLFPFFRFFDTLYVSGDSMFPTYNNGDLLLVQKMYVTRGDWSPHRYDIVSIHRSTGEEWIKRVVGLPGDHIKYGTCRLWVNGIRDYEYEYIQENELPRSTVIMVDITVPENHVWVIGDNRNYSAHSLIHIQDIKGKVVHFE